MKHFNIKLWQAAQAPLTTIDAALSAISKKNGLRRSPSKQAISYSLKPDFVRSFATSGHPFLTFYEFIDLAGWCRDTYFAPDHVDDYVQEAGKSFTVWTHDAATAYRRHVFLDHLSNNVEVSFEIPELNTMSWFPLRISIYDRNGLYFQTDQKLVVERIHEDGGSITSWKKIPQLRTSLPRLHQRTASQV